MPLYRATNSARGSALLGDRVERADSFGTRFKGLLGRTGLEPGGGLHIDPCNSIHMFFMKFALDILFLDGELTVVRAIEGIKPWRATRVYSAASSVLELPTGTIARTGTRPGDQLVFEVVSS